MIGLKAEEQTFLPESFEVHDSGAVIKKAVLVDSGTSLVFEI